MKAFIPDYEVIAPHSLHEVLVLLQEQPGEWKALAGGTDLMVLLEAGKLTPGKYISLQEVKELKTYEETADAILLGALTTFKEIGMNKTLQAEFPLLCAAAAEVGSLAIQNRATIGGNIVNASPAADSLPALLVYDAEIELISLHSSRWIPYKDFPQGYKKMALLPDQLISKVRLPKRGKGWRQFYRKVGVRAAQAITKVAIAVAAKVDASKKIEAFRLAFGSVAPVPLRCIKTEEFLTGKTINPEVIDLAGKKLQEELSPIDDIRSTKNYREKVAQNLLRTFMEQL